MLSLCFLLRTVDLHGTVDAVAKRLTAALHPSGWIPARIKYLYICMVYRQLLRVRLFFSDFKGLY